MTEVAVLKLAPNNTTGYFSSPSGPNRSLMQNSSSVYEGHRHKFGDSKSAELEQEYRHHHKRKKSKKKRDRSNERYRSSSSRKSRSKDQYNNTSEPSYDVHSVGLPSDGASGIKFDLIQDEEDDEEDGSRSGEGMGDILLDGPRGRKRKRVHSPESISGDNNVKVIKRSSNGDTNDYSNLFDHKSRMSSRTEREEETPTPVSGSEEDDDDDFCLVSEEPSYSNSYSYNTGDTVSVVISNHDNHHHYDEEDGEIHQVQVMSDEDDDDDEDNDESTTASTTTSATHLIHEVYDDDDQEDKAIESYNTYHQEELDNSPFAEQSENIRSNVILKDDSNSPVDQVDVEEVSLTSCSQIDVESLHTKQIPNVNGNLDSSGVFHEWHQSYAVDSYSGEPLHILPYAESLISEC